MPYRIGSMFAGIGGTCLGFINAGANIVWANELDQFACKTYRNNFGYNALIEGDIKELDKEEIPLIEILIGGFPCQAFSIAGNRKGFEDTRGTIFFEILDLLEKHNKVHGVYPLAIMLENVKNLLSHNKGNTYKRIKESLEDFGYTVKERVLNSMEYGNVPQNRERIYIVAFRDKEVAKRFCWPDPKPLTNTLSNVIDRNTIYDNKYYYDPNSQYYEMLHSSIGNKNSVYQLRRVYVRENKNNVSPTLTANMGTGGHNVPLIIDNYDNIRKLTPDECLKLQGFPDDFSFPEGMANSHMYKQAGNSVTVTVIESIAEKMFVALREDN